MSDIEFTDKYDQVLLDVPWVTKEDRDGNSFLFKFAQHPDRTGYIFLATDLFTVAYEILIGSALSSRLVSSAKLIPGSQAQDEGEMMDRVEAAVRRIGEAMDDLGEADVSVREDRNYDRVATLKTADFAWIFNLTRVARRSSLITCLCAQLTTPIHRDLRGTKPLSLISRHLLSPLTALIAQDRSIPVSKHDPTEKALQVIGSREVMRGMRRVATRAKDGVVEVDEGCQRAQNGGGVVPSGRVASPPPIERLPPSLARSPPHTRQTPPSPPPPAPAPIDEPSISKCKSPGASASPQTPASHTDGEGSPPAKKKKSKEEREAEEAEEEERAMKRQAALRRQMMKGPKKGGRNRLGL